MTSVRYRFGRFRLDPAARELREDDELVALPARAFDCLAWLVAHRDRAVGRDELIAAVWDRVEVSDALLSHTIVTLRRTLGDSGSDQVLIRTVPRFGYRFVGDLAEDAAQSAGHAAATASPLDASQSGPRESVSSTTQDDAALRRSRAGRARPRARLAATVILSIAALCLALALAWWWGLRGTVDTRSHANGADAHATQTDGAAAVAGNNAVDADPATVAAQEAAPALVLPAEVNAPADWTWLRMGIMDLVAHRLRAGHLRTMPSETVVGLVKRWAPATGAALLRDPRLVPVATLRILPRVHLDAGQWTVRLDAVGVQRTASVEARADDAIGAARAATDALLRKLGHARGGETAAEIPPDLDELLQRSGAAMLADQLDVARRLIDAAPADLQREPRIEQRMAQIELRAGDYASVETRISALLDRLGGPSDAALRARALVTLASAYVRENQIDKATDAYEEAIALREDADDPELLGIAHLGRGIVLAQKSRLDDASAELGVARIALQGIGDALGVAQVDVNLGDFQLLRHRPAEALPMLKNAARQFQVLGAREGYAYALTSQARAERELLEPAAALATTERFWPPETHTSNERLREALRLTRAEVLVDLGRIDAAEALIAHVRASPIDPTDARHARSEALAARITWRRGDTAAAARHAHAALTPALATSDPVLHVRIALLHIRALRADGQGTAAAVATTQLREASASNADAWRDMMVDVADAEQAWAEGQRDAALQQFAAAMDQAVQWHVPEDLVAIAASRLAALIAAGHLDAAREVAGRIAPWADRDLRAAWAQVRLFRALGQDDAARAAEEVATRLAGEGRLPADDGN